MTTSRFARGLAPWALLAAALIAPATATAADDPAAEQLRKEVGKKGWIVMALYAQEVEAKRRLPDDEAGQADLYLMRPDGSEMRNITNTPDRHEFFARFSPDGKKIMYRRLRKSKEIEHDSVGTQGELVVANSDGSNPVAYGKNGEYPWATWSPDIKQIACLEHNEGTIRIYDFETKKQVKQLPSQGIFQQMYWSPDGKYLCGPAEVKGVKWCIISLDIETQQATVLTKYFNCTPNWLRDSSGIVYSCRNPEWGRKGGKGEPYGYTVFFAPAIEDRLRAVGAVYKKAGYMKADLDRLGGRSLGEAVAEGMIALARSIGYPTTLAEVPGFTDAHIKRALAAAKDPKLASKPQNMPIPMTAETVDRYMRPILEAARTGRFDLIRNMA